jgi:hypothetical protein
MTLNYQVILEKYPFPNGVVGSSSHVLKSSLYLTGKIGQVGRKPRAPHRKVGSLPHHPPRGFLSKVGPTCSNSRRITRHLNFSFPYSTIIVRSLELGASSYAYPHHLGWYHIQGKCNMYIASLIPTLIVSCVPKCFLNNSQWQKKKEKKKKKKNKEEGGSVFYRGICNPFTSIGWTSMRA